MQAKARQTSTEDQRSGGPSRGLRKLTVLGAVVAVLMTGACGTSETATPAGGAAPGGAAKAAAPALLSDDQYLTNASDFVDAAKDTWDAKAQVVKVDLGEMFFKPKDIRLEAGKPYVIELKNSGAIKHEFTADKFFRASATRKVDTDSSEVKAPFMSEIEVLAGKTVKYFVIPTLPGSYEMLCEIKGHRESGMEGTITVTGAKPASPAPVYGSVKAGKWLQNGPALVEAASKTWDAKAQTIKMEAGEDGGKMYFKPSNPTLKVGTPYVLHLVNVGTLKHEYTSETFFPTMAFRKAEDSSGEYKAPLLNEAEVKAGKTLDLFLIPTKAGTFKIVCAIPGHEQAGMVGTINVTS
jgi:uncharacterized cupredoxin-like copper-binding protein